VGRRKEMMKNVVGSEEGGRAMTLECVGCW